MSSLEGCTGLAEGDLRSGVRDASDRTLHPCPPSPCLSYGNWCCLEMTLGLIYKGVSRWQGEQVPAALTRPVLSPTRREGSRKEREAWSVTKAAPHNRAGAGGKGSALSDPQPNPGEAQGPGAHCLEHPNRPRPHFLGRKQKGLDG